MKASVKDQWVEDLRSGEYEQGGGNLRRAGHEGEKDQFCCLGVLCEQAVRTGVIPTPELHDDSYSYLDDAYDGDTVTGEAFRQQCSLPRKVAEWAGVLEDKGWLGSDVEIRPAPFEGGYRLTAIGANDQEGMSFLEIADLIDQNVPAE